MIDKNASVGLGLKHLLPPRKTLQEISSLLDRRCMFLTPRRMNIHHVLLNVFPSLGCFNVLADLCTVVKDTQLQPVANGPRLTVQVLTKKGEKCQTILIIKMYSSFILMSQVDESHV